MSNQQSSVVGRCRGCGAALSETDRLQIRGRLFYHIDCAPRSRAPRNFKELLKCFAAWFWS